MVYLILQHFRLTLKLLRGDYTKLLAPHEILVFLRKFTACKPSTVEKFNIPSVGGYDVQ